MGQVAELAAQNDAEPLLSVHGVLDDANVVAVQPPEPSQLADVTQGAPKLLQL